MAASMLLGNAVWGQGCSCGYREPCTITTNLADFVSGTDRTTCTVSSAATPTAVAYTLTTPAGEEYRIENPLTFFADWYVNGEPGVIVRTADPARPCYRTASLQICLGQ